MQTKIVETLTGACILVIALIILGYAYVRTHQAEKTDYVVHARFERVDGLNIGNDVKMGGVKIGRVIRLELDPLTYMAKIVMALDPKVKIPKDASASITSESLLGGKYVDLVAGGSTDYISTGGAIKYTQSAINLESLIGKMVFSSNEKK